MDGAGVNDQASLMLGWFPEFLSLLGSRLMCGAVPAALARVVGLAACPAAVNPAALGCVEAAGCGGTAALTGLVWLIPPRGQC